MNLFRSRLSSGILFGQRWGNRGMCNKVEEVKSQPPPAPPAAEPRPSFKLPGYKPSNMDKKILIWSGRYKTVDQIPTTVSFEMIEHARNKVRVKTAYMMIVGTLVGCVVMVVIGKRAAGRNESLTVYNMEKKAGWSEEYQRERERESATALAKKPE